MSLRLAQMGPVPAATYVVRLPASCRFVVANPMHSRYSCSAAAMLLSCQWLRKAWKGQLAENYAEKKSCFVPVPSGHLHALCSLPTAEIEETKSESTPAPNRDKQMLKVLTRYVLRAQPKGGRSALQPNIMSLEKQFLSRAPTLNTRTNTLCTPRNQITECELPTGLELGHIAGHGWGLLPSQTPITAARPHTLTCSLVDPPKAPQRPSRSHQGGKPARQHETKKDF
jgi:hypothetical protein